MSQLNQSAEPWYLFPLLSRGKLSPRLLAALLVLYAFVRIELKGAETGNWAPDYVFWGNVALLTALYGLGTYKNVSLGDVAPVTPAGVKPAESPTQPGEGSGD